MRPIKIISVEKSRLLEQEADRGGLSFAQMMENAGRLTAVAVDRRLAVRDRRVVVLVGPGNNGGDGLVAAHYLHDMGARVTCYLWHRPGQDDANLRRVEQDGLAVVRAERDPGYAELRRQVLLADAVVDALLGVGVTRPIAGSLRDLLDVARQALAGPGEAATMLVDAVPSIRPRPRPLLVAVDCPTGLDCDTGALDPAALHADLTVTFAYPKTGLLRFPGGDAVGSLVVADIGIPAGLADDVPLELATAMRIAPALPERPRSAHKGTFGKVLVVAGSVNYTGAAALAGAAAARVGTGLVTLAVPMPIQPAVAAHLAEATFLLLPHDMGVISFGAVDVVRERMVDYEALLLGPGLTQEDETVAFVHGLLGLERKERRGRIGFVNRAPEDESEPLPLPPLVVDADGLNALAQAERWWTALPPETVLTPHPGEMARLMGDTATARQVQADREAVCRRMARQWGAVVVLKGAFTVVAASDGRAVVIPFANAGLATAGSGDVLAGAVAGLRAQGMPAFDAAVAGAFLHGLAGELARDDLGDTGTVAGDLLPRLPLALRQLRAAVCQYPI